MRIIIRNAKEDPEEMVADAILALRSVQSVIKNRDRYQLSENRYSIVWESGESYTVTGTQTGWSVAREDQAP